MKKFKIEWSIHVFILLLATFPVITGCSGGSDPIGVTGDYSENLSGSHLSPVMSEAYGSTGRIVWDGYILDIRPMDSTVEVLPMSREIQGHFNVTQFVTKPKCLNCLQIQNISWQPSAGLLDLDALLTNPTIAGGYDVRAVILLDEWNSGRRLESAHGLTDYWSQDPYHPDPFVNYAREEENRHFGPGAQHSAHITLSFPQPYDFLIPFIIDASWPDHPSEPVEMVNPSVEGSIHPTGYDLTISVEILDWQDDVENVYVDCSPLNTSAGFAILEKEVGSTSGTIQGMTMWTIAMKYDPDTWFSWFPEAEGEIELPLIAVDTVTNVRLYNRIAVNIEPDTEPPQWTSEVGVDEVWWGGTRAIISYFPATDPSGPVRYNIYASTDVPFVPTIQYIATGTAHYAVETLDTTTYEFIVRAEDQAGNEDTNDIVISGMTVPLLELWNQELGGDIESSPTCIDMNEDQIEDVIFGCDDGNVYCLAGNNGNIQWQFITGGMVKSSPAAADVTGDNLIDILIGSCDTNVYALNLIGIDPFPVKTYITPDIVESSPVCVDLTGDNVPEVVAGSYDNYLYIFGGSSGVIISNFDAGSVVKATPAVEDFNHDTYPDIVVASGGILNVISGIDGQILWTWDFETGFSCGSPAIGDLNQDGTGDVVAGSGSSIYAFDVENNSLIWSCDSLEGNFDTSPALGDFTDDGIPDVVISSRYIGVFLLDGSNGSVLWACEDEIYMPTSPSVGDMNNDSIADVVVGSSDFRLRILNGADGYTLYEWDTTPAGAVTTVPLLADVDQDGDIDIVFGTESHEIWALTTNHPVPADADLLPWPKFMRTRANTGNLDDPLI